MARAHFADYVLDRNGRPISLVNITLYNPGTTTPISQTIYANATGETTLSNPFMLGATGEVEFYLDNSAQVDVHYSKTGYIAETHTVDVISISDSDVGTHSSDTTDVHGIADTTVLSLASHAHAGIYEPVATAHHARHEAGGADALAIDAAAGTGSLRTLGTGATQAAVGSHAHSGTTVPVYIWDGVSDYDLGTGRIFIGPNDPAGEGFTLADGDLWEDTSA